MKKFSLVSLFLLLSSIVISYSCSNELEDVGSTSAEGRMVTITTRSSTTAEIEYPITLYAFRNSDGKLVKKVTANSSNDDVRMVLTEGSYEMVAISGYNELQLPTSPTLQTSMGVPTDKAMTNALLAGRANVNVSNTDVEVKINMSYQVAMVNLKLQDIPADITAVSVTLEPISNMLTFGGSLSGSNTITMNLEKQGDGTWNAPTSYILPSITNTQLALSISMKDATTTMTYGYTHTTNLKAGTPYNLVGSYKGEFVVSGTISSDGWATTETIDFKFGPGAEEDNTGSDDTGGYDDNEGAGNEDAGDEGGDSDGIYIVDAIPADETAWNNHFVVSKMQNNDGTYDLFLMSKKEYRILKSEAENKRASYEENGMSEWLIPTTDELDKILTHVVAEVAKTNNTLSTIEGDKVSVDYKYLCDSGNNYLMLNMPNSFPTKDSDTYSLRLVKTVKVKLQSTEGQ